MGIEHVIYVGYMVLVNLAFVAFAIIHHPGLFWIVLLWLVIYLGSTFLLLWR